MSKHVLLEIAGRAKAQLRAHWADCLEYNLADHSPEAHALVDQAVDAYFARLTSLGYPADEASIVAAIKALFATLTGLSQRFGSGLLETDERELIVTQVLEGASEAGLDLTRFPDSDPTLQFRNF
jgi:hypothetical protein